MNIGDRVLVRTYSAGVCIGVLKEKSKTGKRVVLTDAQIVHSWQGALSTLDLAQTGPTGAKLSQPVGEHEVTEAISTTVMTAAAVKAFSEIKPWKR